MVYDPPSEEAAKAAEAAESRPANIRVMKVQFHANNTFSTMAGLGESILRGKFDVIGQDKDQLWMQIWRFGFGRSVSGSVYSEGRMLTHEDAKTYWGTIKYEETKEDDKPSSGEEEAPKPAENSAEGDRLEVKGSVMIGWGIEPVPEARFMMRETVAEDDMLLEDEEEEEDDADDSLASLELDFESSDHGNTLEGDGINLSDEDDSAFQ